MFEILYTEEALDDLRLFRRLEQTNIVDGLEVQLREEPTVEIRNRKRLRPNRLAEWELRIGEFRVFYDVNDDAKSVRVVAIGYKRKNSLFIHGEEFEL